MSETQTHTVGPPEEKPRVVAARPLRDCRLPAPGDVVTGIEWNGGGTATISFEPSATFYARHLLAEPRRLLWWALRIAWYDLRHASNRPIETVRDALAHIDYEREIKSMRKVQ